MDSGFPTWLSGEEFTYQCRRHEFKPWSRNIPWRRKWQPTPVFSPGQFHKQRSLVSYSHGVAESWTWLSTHGVWVGGSMDSCLLISSGCSSWRRYSQRELLQPSFHVFFIFSIILWRLFYFWHSKMPQAHLAFWFCFVLKQEGMPLTSSFTKIKLYHLCH